MALDIVVVASPTVMPREPVPGEVWEISGVIRSHPKHGPQVDAATATLLRPSGRLIISAIARNPLFPGIGPKKTQQLWDRFGEDIYTLLDSADPVPFAEIIGDELAQILVEGWAEIGAEIAVYEWLDRHGVNPGLARSIATIYSADAIEKLEENPYRLLAFSSWPHVDALARSMGVSPDDERRRVAAADATVYQRLDSRHTVTDAESFRDLLRRRLGCDAEGVQEALGAALRGGAVVRVGDAIQGTGAASMERFIADRVIAMVRGRFEADQTMLQAPVDVDRIAADFARREGITLNTEQLAALRMAARQPVCCISGGAGTGKTTLLRAVIDAIEKSGGGCRAVCARRPRSAAHVRIDAQAGHDDRQAAQGLRQRRTGPGSRPDRRDRRGLDDRSAAHVSRAAEDAAWHEADHGRRSCATAANQLWARFSRARRM